MRKIKKITMLIIIFAMFLAIKVNATELNVSIWGDSKGKAGEKKTVTVNVSSSEQEILSLSGVISSEGIERIGLDDITIPSKWTIEYNEVQGTL